MTKQYGQTLNSEKKVVLVTGAARGIGLATAQRFLAEGWQVVGMDNRGEALEEAFRDLGTNAALAIAGDVSIPDDVDRVVAKTKDAFGRIDALVNNAGIADFAPALEHDFALWRSVMATNLDGVFLMTQAVLPIMIEGGEGGAIVNIASISGLRASTTRVAYGTSKAAVAHLAKQYAAEFGDYGIRVNVVAPGPVETAMARKVHTPAIRKAYHDLMPLNRHGDESELASAIWFLCSPDSTFITGQVLAVDGGFDATGVGLPELPTRKT